MGSIIDAHMHLFGEGYLSPVWYQRAAERWAAAAWPHRDPQSINIESGLVDAAGSLLFAEFDKAGIAAGVAMGLDWGIELGEPPVPLRDVHRHYSEMQRHFPGRFFGVAGIDPRRPDAVGLLEEAIVRLGLKALKMYPPCGFFPFEPVCRPLYDKCLDLGVPVVFHTAVVGFPHVARFANPLNVGDVQALYPSLTIVFAHAGYPLWAREAMEMVAHHPNSYLEISNWNLAMDRDPDALVRLLVEMRDAVGAHRVLFASDHLGGRRFSGSRSRLAHWVNFVQELPERAARLGLTVSREEMELIMGENARRVYKLGDAVGGTRQAATGQR